MANPSQGRQILAAVRESFRPPVPPARVRWAIRRDVEHCGAIDPAYTAETMLADLRDRHTVAVVATHGDAISGFAVYRLESGAVRVLRLATDVGAFGRSAREWLLGVLLRKVDGHRRERLVLPYAVALLLAAVEPAGVPYEPHATFGPALAALGVEGLPAVEPNWLTGDVRALAAVEPQPPLPILADALQDAGCADEVLLGALRADGPVAGRVFAGLRGALRGE